MQTPKIKILRKIPKEEIQNKIDNDFSEKNFQKSEKKFSKKPNSEKFWKNFKKSDSRREFQKNFWKNEKNFTSLSKNSHQKNQKNFSQRSDIIKDFLKNFSMENNQIFITCQAWLESLVKKDNEKLGIDNFEIQDRIVRATATEKQLYEALIWNRFANRVYLELSREKCETFDELFDIVSEIPWKKLLPSGIAIVTEATAIRSALAHTPSLQSITKKAIVNSLTEGTGTHHLYEDRTGDEAHIQIFIIENISYILLDITGNALHKRGWRTESGEAPIKETLAAAIIALSGWKFREKFLDPFCGSGTIAIEAALLARNIAPGIWRHFAIENFPIFNKEIFQKIREESRQKAYPSGNYQIFASDISDEVLQKAKNNAMRAGVENDIIFEKSDFFEKNFDEKTTIITNPPYNIRLELDDENFYKNFIKILENEHISGGFITSYEIEKFLQKNLWKDRKLYNGGLLARFYKKI